MLTEIYLPSRDPQIQFTGGGESVIRNLLERFVPEDIERWLDCIAQEPRLLAKKV